MFAIRRKAWGYAADQRPSTHPVAPADVSDAAQALVNFDGISYAKGAAVLRQLAAWIGDEAFLNGLRAHIAAHRFGNATLADLLAAFSAASGRDLAVWAEVWLRHAQVNTLRTEVELDSAGRYARVAVVQSAPPEHPVLRPHRIGIGCYDHDGTAARLVDRFEVDVDPTADGGRTVLTRLAGRPAARLLLPNDGDLAYAKIRLDPASVAAVPELLPTLADPLARAVLWGEVLDAVTDAERPVADLVALIRTALPAETEVIIVEAVLTLAGALIDRYLDAAGRRATWAQLAQTAEHILATAPTAAVDDVTGDGRSIRLAAFRALVASCADDTRLAGWLAGRGVPAGITIDTELRWTVLSRRCVLGTVGEAEIAAEERADRSATGQQWAAGCRAALPDPAAKERAWRIITVDDSLSNRLVEVTAAAFWQPDQQELTEPYVERYFAEIPAMARRRTAWMAEAVAARAFPRYAVTERTRQLAAALLARDDLTAGLRRAVTDADDDLRRALRARTADEMLPTIR